jgi:hypothetical protein
VPRVASGARRDSLPCQGVTEISMSAGRKESPEKYALPRLTKKNPDRPLTEVPKDAASHADVPTKSGKTEFAQATYYRQGVLVPGGPHKGALPRTRYR